MILRRFFRRRRLLAMALDIAGARKRSFVRQWKIGQIDLQFVRFPCNQGGQIDANLSGSQFVLLKFMEWSGLRPVDALSDFEFPKERREVVDLDDLVMGLRL